MNILGITAAFVLILMAFFPWVTLPERDIVISGIAAEKFNYGKPGYLHFVLAGAFVIFSLVNKIWAKRANNLLAALNLAWAVRNYFALSVCSGGECPEKQWALYLVVGASFLMLLTSLFPAMKVKNARMPR